jgi:hypothetical protein
MSGANHAFRTDTTSANAGVVIIEGGFQTSGAADPTYFNSADGIKSSSTPNGVSKVTHISTGIYKLEFTDSWYTCVSALVGLELATPADKHAQFNGFENMNNAATATSATSCFISTFGTSALADISVSSGATDGVWFRFAMKRSAVI